MQLSKHYPTQCNDLLNSTLGSAIKVLKAYKKLPPPPTMVQQTPGQVDRTRPFPLLHHTDFPPSLGHVCCVVCLTWKGLPHNLRTPAPTHCIIQSKCKGRLLPAAALACVSFLQCRDWDRKAFICWGAFVGFLQPAWKLLEAGGSRVSLPPHVQSL